RRWAVGRLVGVAGAGLRQHGRGREQQHRHGEQFSHGPADYRIGNVANEHQLAKMASISAAFCGRTTRAFSAPASRKISVGHNLTRNERPSGRPLPSSTLMCRTEGCFPSTAAMSGWAARQYPHQLAPNSRSMGPGYASTSARVGSGMRQAYIGALHRRTRKPSQTEVPTHIYTAASLDNDRCRVDSLCCCGGFMATNNIVLVHGLWMTPLSFEYWAHHYSELGYSVYAPSWPGMERDIRALRRAPDGYAALGIREIVEHYERFALALDEPPILIGHGFGGLVVQSLLDRGLGTCGVAVASAPIKGIWTLPYSKMRVVTPQLIRPRQRGCVQLTPAQFHYGFMNNASRDESQRAWERYAVPGPRRVLLQAEFANLNPFAHNAINVRRNNRAPLLMIAGS